MLHNIYDRLYCPRDSTVVNANVTRVVTEYGTRLLSKPQISKHPKNFAKINFIVMFTIHLTSAFFPSFL